MKKKPAGKFDHSQSKVKFFVVLISREVIMRESESFNWLIDSIQGSVGVLFSDLNPIELYRTTKISTWGALDVTITSRKGLKTSFTKWRI